MISNRHSVTLLSVLTVLFLTTCKPEKEEPKPLTAPVLTTMEAGDITAVSALSGGAISSDGGSPVTARGIVWGISHNPTLADSVSEEGTGIGSFTSDLTPLKYSTTYYVRAYATNSIGTTYGNEVTFVSKPAIPSNGLIAWWPFDGNPNDESGNGHNGTIQNDVQLTTDRFNCPNSAYIFNGFNEILVNHDDQLNLDQDISISAWFNSYGPPLYRTNHTIIAKRSDPDSNIPYDLVINYQYGIPSDYKKPMFVTASTLGYQFLQATDEIINYEWSHIVATVESNFLNIYLNGNKIYTSMVDPSLRVQNNNPILIGSGTRPDKPAEQFDGKLDDIAIYNRALTAEEIQKIYNGTGF